MTGRSRALAAFAGAGVMAASLASWAILASGPAWAGDARRGAAFAEGRCGQCHAVGRTGVSPNRLSPPFRVISRRYKPEDLEESFAEGIVTGHGGMPEIVLSPQQIDDLTAHLRTLRRAAR
jgi:cytochrome c